MGAVGPGAELDAVRVGWQRGIWGGRGGVKAVTLCMMQPSLKSSLRTIANRCDKQTSIVLKGLGNYTADVLR